MNYLNGGAIITVALIAIGAFMVQGDVSHLAASPAGTGK